MTKEINKKLLETRRELPTWMSRDVVPRDFVGAFLFLQKNSYHKAPLIAVVLMQPLRSDFFAIRPSV